jgi:prepilin-type N-terminal cleavage/methylation domain-containing protein
MKNSHGFSLIEVMIALAIMGFVSAGMANMSIMMSKQNTIQNVFNDIQNLTNSANSILSSQASCTLAFKGKNYDPLSFPQKINGKVGLNGISFAEGSNWGNISVESLEWVGPDTDLGITSMDIGGVQANLHVHFANLMIHIKPTSSLISSMAFSRKLSFVVSTDSTNIVQSCLSTSANYESLCTNVFGGVFSNGQCRQVFRQNINNYSEGSLCTVSGESYYQPGIGLLVCDGSKFELLASRSR